MNNSFNVSLLLKQLIPVVIVVNITLLLFGLVFYPSVIGENGLLGIVAASAILLTYGYLALFSPVSVEKVRPGLLKIAELLGLVGGLALAFDLVSDYIIEHDAGTSSTSSLVAYGFFLLLVLTSGILGARLTGKIRSGLTGALWCVMIALLLWFFVEFVSFYVFSSTVKGAKFIQLEMQIDFERSHSTDFNGFVMSDFYGAGFYHLLLGLFFAVFLGFVGGLLGRVFHRK